MSCLKLYPCFGIVLCHCSSQLKVLLLCPCFLNSLRRWHVTVSLLIPNDSVCQAVPFGYRAVIKTIEHRRQQKVYSGIGIVKLPDLTPTVVPAGQNVVLEGVVSVRGQVAEKWAVMEPPLYSPFPGGLLVASCLLNLPQHPSRKVPVVLKNETEHDIIIPGKSVIADIHALQKVIYHKVTKSDRSVSSVRSKSAEELCFDFCDSCVPEVWKKRITQKLCHA